MIRRQRVRRAMMRLFKALSSAVKSAVRSCFGSSSEEMSGEIFVKAHIVNGKVIQSQHEDGTAVDLVGGQTAKNSAEENVRQHDVKSCESLEAESESNESVSDERKLPCSSDAVEMTSATETCGEQSAMASSASEQEVFEKRGLDDEAETHFNAVQDDLKTSSRSSLAQWMYGCEKDTGWGSGSQCVTKRMEQDEKHCEDSQPAAAHVICSPFIVSKDTELELFGQTDTAFSETFRRANLLAGSGENEERTGNGESSAVDHSCSEDSCCDSDHSSMAASFSDDGEWAEEVVVFSRPRRLSSSAQRAEAAGQYLQQNCVDDRRGCLPR